MVPSAGEGGGAFAPAFDGCERVTMRKKGQQSSSDKGRGTVKLGSFRSLQWAFPLAVALHNCEEAIFMPGWLATHRDRMFMHPSSWTVWAGLLLTAVAAFVVTWLSALRGRQSVWAYLLFGGAATMLINVFVPHLPATLIFRQYTPGVVTAVLINLPVMTAVLYTAVRDGWVSGARAVRYAVLTPLIIAAVVLVGLASG